MNKSARAIIKLAVKELQSAKFYAISLVLVMLVGILSLSLGISSLMDIVVIRNTGRIGVTANSGSAQDIQAAVDEVAAMGGGNVYIPEGTFNFVEIGDTWQTVYIPAGVNLFGAPTERTSDQPVPPRGMNPNNQVVEWKTKLIMPYEVPSPTDKEPIWFINKGNGDPEKPSRFSDIAMYGYRDIDPDSRTMYTGVWIEDVINFRVDHCLFHHVTKNGVWVQGTAESGYLCCGVIDHCRFENEIGVPFPYDERTVEYGVGMRFTGNTRWEDIDKVVGHYTEYSIYIEDCYFRRWRHCTAANDGAHYVVRHNTVGEGNWGNNNFDAHGSYGEGDYGNRAIEEYNNLMLTPSDKYRPGEGIASMIRGGGGCIFNNEIHGYYVFLYLRNDYAPMEICRTKDLWIWNNTWDEVCGYCPLIEVDGDPEGEGGDVGEVQYTLAEKPGYTPYPYPHPLTLQTYP